jgi:hypothetical protein
MEIDRSSINKGNVSDFDPLHALERRKGRPSHNPPFPILPNASPSAPSETNNSSAEKYSVMQRNIT